ncbi:MAG: hypothetical protein L0Y72_09135 [Gemmataceae bacterium]|nr:hypothetical protein [Gemmataceae bacterium]MCI0739195.1 hypothetical protein [Gemmataceae bacterium]
MIRTRYLAAACSALLFCNTAFAQTKNEIKWTTGYPKTGTIGSTVVAKGTVTLDADWKINGITAFYWENGKKVLLAQSKWTAKYEWGADAKTGAWIELVLVYFSAGTSLNIVVDAYIENTKTGQKVTLRTQPKTATTK